MGLGFMINSDLFALKIFTTFMRGILGHSEETENNAEEIIKNASEETFNLARAFVSHFKVADILMLMHIVLDSHLKPHI